MNMPILDLDAARETRSAAREGRAAEMPVRFRGTTIAVLPAELPLDVLAPLRSIDGDLTLILREVMTAAQREKSATDGLNLDATMLVIDLLAGNPNLPTTAVDTFADVARNLLGTEGFAALAEGRPSAQDYAALARGVFEWYGVSLGESSPSSGSQGNEDGSETSSTTSSTTSTGSTPEASGPIPATPASSGSAVS